MRWSAPATTSESTSGDSRLHRPPGREPSRQEAVPDQVVHAHVRVERRPSQDAQPGKPLQHGSGHAALRRRDGLWSAEELGRLVRSQRHAHSAGLGGRCTRGGVAVPSRTPANRSIAASLRRIGRCRCEYCWQPDGLHQGDALPAVGERDHRLFSHSMSASNAVWRQRIATTTSVRPISSRSCSGESIGASPTTRSLPPVGRLIAQPLQDVVLLPRVVGRRRR